MVGLLHQQTALLKYYLFIKKNHTHSFSRNYILGVLFWGLLIMLLFLQIK